MGIAKYQIDKAALISLAVLLLTKAIEQIEAGNILVGIIFVVSALALLCVVFFMFEHSIETKYGLKLKKKA